MKVFTDTALFAGVRALFIGALGALAVVAGSKFIGFQRSARIVLGAIYGG